MSNKGLLTYFKPRGRGLKRESPTVRQEKMKTITAIACTVLFCSCATHRAPPEIAGAATMSEAQAILQKHTIPGKTTYREFVDMFGKGQNWMRGFDATDPSGTEIFCWTLIFKQTDGSVHVHFVGDPGGDPAQWTVHSFAQHATPDILKRNTPREIKIDM